MEFGAICDDRAPSSDKESAVVLAAGSDTALCDERSQASADTHEAKQNRALSDLSNPRLSLGFMNSWVMPRRRTNAPHPPV